MIRLVTSRLSGIRIRAMVTVGCGLAGLFLAVTLRVLLAGLQGASSPVAGAVFGIGLLLVTVACGMQRPKFGMRHVAWGVGAAAVFCVPPLLQRFVHGGVDEPSAALPLWAAVVTLVALAEELLLRGALFEAAVRWLGECEAIAITAVAFSLLHVPVYGWHVALLDLAVGVALGVLRVVAGSVSAPALAHVLADLAGWWLR